jgi:hypothetical protein
LDRKKAKKIILDEARRAEEILSSVVLEIKFDDVVLLAKYFFSKGLKPKQVKDKIIENCKRSELFNLMFFDKMIGVAVKKARLYNLRISNLKIAITKKEIDKLKKIPHKDYEVILYMLFVAKLQKFQSIKKDAVGQVKSFRTYFNYTLEDAMYSSGVYKEHGVGSSKKDLIRIGREIFKNKIGTPFLNYNWEMICADFESRDVEFILDGDLDFRSQIKYYCLGCGKQYDKIKRYDFCEDCHSEDLKKRNLKSQKKKRLS